MSGHAIFAIGGNESGKTVYCTCGANIHEPSNTPMLSAWSKHVEQVVREEVMREAGVSVHAEQAAMSADVSCRLVREDKIRELIAQEIESERGAGNAFRDATIDRAAAIARGEWS
ncbi:hypothetical protein [Propionimicrobium sp. PCR01-08-3]|uniref:hypothetical protein n=1 Tax=Propionimicrobium sp. PCR01-08-3 TaxID=3052086 RepID=UPI00255C94FB|nr:hypothetical protein [Propionimicrobium sp. PCR01-08-3]WIY84315.1 hypothetical protein QQ658_15250 [Propionimicrobium sp. PCR01-08-3]